MQSALPSAAGSAAPSEAELQQIHRFLLTCMLQLKIIL